MSYHETFIQVAPDCPVSSAVVPVAKGAGKSVPVLEYELLSGAPYKYTMEELLFEVHVRRSAVPAGELKARREALWAEFFAKPRACLRASTLAKKYGWGFHFDKDGRVALVALGSADYKKYSSGASGLKVLAAMRSKRE
jgi:hypothetical protein